MLHKKVEDWSGRVSFFYMIRTLTTVKPTINLVVSITRFHPLSLVGGLFTWVHSLDVQIVENGKEHLKDLALTPLETRSCSTRSR
jgi:hypothetical protein